MCAAVRESTGSVGTEVSSQTKRGRSGSDSTQTQMMSVMSERNLVMVRFTTPLATPLGRIEVFSGIQTKMVLL